MIAGGGERLLLIESLFGSLSDWPNEAILLSGSLLMCEAVAVFSGSLFILFFLYIGLASRA